MKSLWRWVPVFKIDLSHLKSDSKHFVSHNLTSFFYQPQHISKRASYFNLTTGCQHHLQRKDFFVNGVEESHCFSPRGKPCNITANFLGNFYGVILHFKIRHQQLNCFFIDGILRMKRILRCKTEQKRMQLLELGKETVESRQTSKRNQISEL